MSNLTDFFPSSSGSSENNAWVLLVGGGGGGGAGMVNCCKASIYNPAGTIYGCLGFGGGGGGVYVGGFQICPGVSYPVVVGAGGACGCMKNECAGEPGGAGSNGGISRFGNCIVMGGGGAGTFCWNYCAAPTGTALSIQEGKIVDNKHGANSGSMMRFMCYCQTCINRNCNGYMLTQSTIDGFRVDSIDSAGGGMQAVYQCMYCCPGTAAQQVQKQYQVNVGDGYILECNPTNDSWELKSTFFGLKVIPEQPTCPSFVLYCCTPTTIPPGTNPAPCGGDACAPCYGFKYKYIPAANYQLGVSRNQEKCSLGSPCFCACTACCVTYRTCNNLMQPHIANTGAGGLNQICPGHPDYTTLCNGWNCAPSPFFWSATGTDGVVYVVYDCSLGAASSTPGAVDCTPVTGPDGYRSYRYTSSGSFTL